MIASTLKNQFKLSFRKVKKVAATGSSEANLVLRSLYAQKMLLMYEQLNRFHVVNVDESWLPESDFRRFNWDLRGQQHSIPRRSLGRKVNMIVAVSSRGYVWLSLTQPNTDEDVMKLYLQQLSKTFQSQFGEGWKEEIVLLIDGASYHRSAGTRACIQ